MYDRGSLMKYGRWPFRSHVLYLEAEGQARDNIADELRSAGCSCRVSNSLKSGLDHLRSDSRVQVVILDHSVAGRDVGFATSRIRLTRPQAMIMGSTVEAGCHEFLASGVKRMLLKPWNICDLIDLLADSVLNCVSCNLPLPLRFPEPGESGQDWACVGCSCRYRAILEDDAPAIMVRNVRRAARPGATGTRPAGHLGQLLSTTRDRRHLGGRAPSALT